MRYEVRTYETMYRTYVVDIDTEDAKEAREMAAGQINSGALVAPEPELVEKCIKAVGENDGSEWRAF